MEITVRGDAVRVATGGKDHGNDSPAIVFVHGAGMDRTTWQMQTRWFAHHGFRVAAIDLPGHGLSAGVPLSTVSDMAEWLVEVIDELDLAPAHIVGLSLGTYIGLEIADKHPEVVRSLVLIGTASAMPVHPALLEAAVDDVPTASRLMTSWSIGSRAQRGGHRSPGMWLIGSSNALIDSSPRGALSADMQACNAYGGANAAAAGVSCPVTFILGSEDKMTPIKSSGELIGAVSTSRVITMDAIGHMMPIEAPILVRKAISEAIDWAEALQEST